MSIFEKFCWEGSELWRGLSYGAVLLLESQGFFKITYVIVSFSFLYLLSKEINIDITCHWYHRKYNTYIKVSHGPPQENGGGGGQFHWSLGDPKFLPASGKGLRQMEDLTFVKSLLQVIFNFSNENNFFRVV